MSNNNYNRGCNCIYNTFDENSSSEYKYHWTPNHTTFDKKCHLPAFPLDELDYQFKNIGVMKIDVEGFEFLVLNGARNIIMKYRPVIIIEIFNQNVEMVLNLLQKEMYYEVQYLGNEDYVCKPLKI
jgi:hypothetical protein